MKTKRFLFYILILPSILVASCGAPAAPQVATEQATEVPIPNVTPTSPPDNTPSEEIAITHTDIPISLPDSSNGVAADFDSFNVLANGFLVGGDRFTFGRFERPFNANTMDTYYAEIDIINTEIFQDDTWIYGRLSIKDLNASSSKTASYAIEFDITLNGKADWLILSLKPTSTEWSVDGVQIYKDTNTDIGGTSAYLADDPLPGGDGFETVIFDQGKGNDPDSAWTRVSPSDPNLIEFAIKRSALESPTQFMVNMWAGYTLNPAMFDINDQYTHEQAGAADAGLEYFYPIKAVAEIDNSCRIPVGFQPTGNEPGLCITSQQNASEEDASVSACPSGTTLQCSAFEGCFCLP